MLIGQICFQKHKLVSSSSCSFVMYVCHALNFIAMTLIQTRKSAANCIFTSNASVNIDLEIDCTLFHSHDSFMWALVGVMAYCIIMSLVISKPCYVDVFLIFSIYCLTSWKMISLPLTSPIDPTRGILCFLLETLSHCAIEKK